MILGLALLWQVYGVWLDNPLLVPRLSDTLVALMEGMASGEIPKKVLISLKVLLTGYALGIFFAFVLTGLAATSRIGASLLVTVMAVWLTNTRLMPMVITLMPHLRHRRGIGWRHYLIAHFIAITSWAVALKRCPELPPEDRFAWFTGLALGLWGMSLLGTAIGFWLAGSLPVPVTLGLVFLNPCYFTLLFVADFRPRARLLALRLARGNIALGVVAGVVCLIVLTAAGLRLWG